MTDRIGCLAPSCRRTIGAPAFAKRFGLPIGPATQWICADHWRFVPQSWRKVYARVRRRERRFGVRLPASGRLWARIARLIAADTEGGG